eukprot:5779164-Pyramimonas_sp.AAC.1
MRVGGLGGRGIMATSTTVDTMAMIVAMLVATIVDTMIVLVATTAPMPITPTTMTASSRRP